MIENELESCLEQTLKFGAEYDAYRTLCARLDVDRITLEDRFEPGATVCE
jgi:hypothetical protein